MTSLENNKAKTARRVVEVLEFFDDQNRQITVMDIVRRYNRPQSSTSELLASLVDLGLLYKNAGSRSYALTPRAALLGSLSQPSIIRDGSLSMLIDRLVAQTGLGTALLGMVGLNTQIFRWCAASKHEAEERGRLAGGEQDYLSDSAAGWLLLSTIPAARCASVVRRLNAEAPAHRKFDYTAMMQRVQTCGRQNYAIGRASFDSTAEMAAVLLPTQSGQAPLVLGFAYQPSEVIDPATLVELLQSSVQRCLRLPDIDRLTRDPASNAALPFRFQPTRHDGAMQKAM